LACYQESLQVRRQIVDEFGKTPESLRDLLVSHAKMALALSGMGNHLLACEHARNALQLATALLENHPDDPQTQEDYRNAQILASEVLWLDALRREMKYACALGVRYTLPR
jgi:hypothetical protein